MMKFHSQDFGCSEKGVTYSFSHNCSVFPRWKGLTCSPFSNLLLWTGKVKEQDGFLVLGVCLVGFVIGFVHLFWFFFLT